MRPPRASVRTCPRRGRHYSVLSAGNVRVTVGNYEYGVTGSRSNGGGEPGLPSPLPRIRVACQVPPGSGGRSTASEWNVPSRLKVRSPKGPKDHLRPPTCSLFFFFFPDSSFICCSRFTAGGASVKSTPLNLFHLQYDPVNWNPTGSGERTTAWPPRCGTGL